jgi:hypothetical protein
MSDKELRADLEELRKLEAAAQRANVKNVLHQEIIRLEASLHIVAFNDPDRGKSQSKPAREGWRKREA